MDKIKEAYKIAAKCLRDCYTEKGILAGRSLWFDYWARDAFFASWGSLALGDHETAKKNLVFFIRYQKKNGQLPLRVDKHQLILKLIGIRIDRGLKAKYLEDKMKAYPRDQNSLFIISALKYIESTNDKKFAKTHFNNFEKALEWSLSKDFNDDLLIEGFYYATWADSLRKLGTVLYTNVLHCKAVESMAEICKIVGEEKKSKQYFELHKAIKKQINDLFWNGEYYIDWFNVGIKHKTFSSDGNILAILFGIADEKKAESIMGFIEKNNIESFSLATNFPKYPFWNISPSLILVGISDYHNGMQWLWIGCLDVIAKLKLGMNKEAALLLKNMAEKIVEYGSVYEVYGKDGRPVSRAFFKSESTFAWSAGLFVLAVKEFKKRS